MQNPIRSKLPLAAVLLALGAAPAAAQDVVPGLRLNPGAIQPGTTTFTVSFSVPNQQPVQVGTITEEVRRIDHAGKPALLRATTFERTGATLVDTAIAVRATMAPLYHRSHQLRQTMTLVFDGRRVRAAVVPRDTSSAGHEEHGGEHAGHAQPSGQAQPAGQAQHAGHGDEDHAHHAADPALGEAKEFEAPMFDSNAIELVLGAAPLAEGWERSLPFYVHERGGLVRIAAKVEGRTPPPWVEGAAPAWQVRVAYPDSPITYWIDPTTRRLVAQQVETARGFIRMTPTQ